MQSIAREVVFCLSFNFCHIQNLQNVPHDNTETTNKICPHEYVQVVSEHACQKHIKVDKEKIENEYCISIVPSNGGRTGGTLQK